MADQGAAGDVADTVEEIAHSAASLAGKGVAIPLAAAGGLIQTVAQTMHALADFVEELGQGAVGGGNK